MQTEERVPRIAVIGAGVSALSTVWCLKRELPEAGISRFKITMFADKILSETLSSGAGGIFRPDPDIGVEKEKNEEWARVSFSHFANIANSPVARQAGVFFVTGVHVTSTSSFSLDHIRPFAPDLRLLTPDELSAIPPGGKFRFGYRYTSIISDPKFYLKWLLAHALTTCDLVIRRIESLEEEEILSTYDVIVNCTGLGSRHLAHDRQLTPIRGQTIRVHGPWIKSFTWADGAYVYPMADGSVTLGGIKQLGNEETAVDPDDKEWIWRRCTEVVPSLSDCVIEADWVGLRPFRHPIRVEKQVLSNGRLVVHNYGHGGNGYTYSMGTAIDATRLVIQSLTSSSGHAKQASKL